MMPMSHNNRHQRVWLQMLPLLILILLPVSCGDSRDDTGSHTDLPLVKVRKPKSVSRPVQISVSGSVEADQKAKFGFTVAGKVLRVAVEEGDFVRKGSIVAELDPVDYQHAVDVAAADVAAAKAVYEKALAGPREQEVDQARVAAERAESEYHRMKTLYERKSLPRRDFEKAEAVWKAARDQYSMARDGARVEDKKAAKATLEKARAAEKIARKRLADCTLHAPISGWVARRGVEPGESIAAGMPVFAIVDLDPVKVRAGVPESDVAKIRPGLPATVQVPALPESSFEGRVELVGVAADPMSRTYTTKIVIPNPDSVLRAGMVAEALIHGDEKVEALTVPGEAIVRDPDGATLVYTYFPEQRRVYAKRVETGTVYGREVEITSGLSGDELVVVTGQNKLRDGVRVKAEEIRP